ncbi:hypothetical protein FRC19_001382 [Serendipita sp. 401]|nr:hypothetical protein FRC19_001382 [Serendipita sp. 401]
MSTANANNARTPLDSTSSRNATDTRKRSSNKLAKKSQKDKSKNGSTKGAAGSAIINALFWVLSIGFVLGALALVPGPLQDRLLVAIGRLERKDTSGLYPVKTKILADREKRASIFRAFQNGTHSVQTNITQCPSLVAISHNLNRQALVQA